MLDRHAGTEPEGAKLGSAQQKQVQHAARLVVFEDRFAGPQNALDAGQRLGLRIQRNRAATAPRSFDQLQFKLASSRFQLTRPISRLRRVVDQRSQIDLAVNPIEVLAQFLALRR